MLVEHLQQRMVERLRRGEIGAERLLDDDPPPGAVLLAREAVTTLDGQGECFPGLPQPHLGLLVDHQVTLGDDDLGGTIRRPRAINQKFAFYLGADTSRVPAEATPQT